MSPTLEQQYAERARELGRRGRIVAVRTFYGDFLVFWSHVTERWGQPRWAVAHRL